MSDDRSNVVGLHDGCFQAPGTVNEAVVAKLRDWLAKAERGEIDGVAMAASKPNNKVIFDYALGPDGATFRVIAATALLDGELRQLMVGSAEDEPTHAS